MTVRNVLHILAVGWGELLRIIRENVGRLGTRTEDNMVVVFWTCVAVLAVALAVILPWQVVAATALMMTALVLVIGWNTRK
jgi:hypothetical protein